MYPKTKILFTEMSDHSLQDPLCMLTCVKIKLKCKYYTYQNKKKKKTM